MDFWEVYDLEYDRVRKFILGSVRDEWVADDLVQETFVRAHAGLSGLRDGEKVSSWIFSIAYNLCRDHFREAKKSSGNKAEDLDATTFSDAPSAQRELEQRQMGDCVQETVNQLPDSLRTVVYLYDMLEFSHAEIGEILGITTENAKVRLHRARKKLKSLLEEKCTFRVDERNVFICEPQPAKQTDSPHRVARPETLPGE